MGRRRREGAKFWLSVLTEIKNRGVQDVCILVCDGLRGLPDSVAAVWPLTVVQTCVIHLLRNTFRYAGRQDWDRRAKDLRPVYTAPTAARPRRGSPTSPTPGGPATRPWCGSRATRGPRTPPFLDYDVEIRNVICSTNAIESLNARYRRAIRARGHFPTEQAALTCLYLATRALDPTGRGRARWVIRWKPALNAFAITFEGRLHPTNN